MKNIFITLILNLFISYGVLAQLPSLNNFKELSDPVTKDVKSWNDIPAGANSGFVSSDQHFERSSAPKKEHVVKEWNKKGWRGERVQTQALLYSTLPLNNIQLELSDLVSSNEKVISSEHASANFVRYVLADHLGDLETGCDISVVLETSLRADMIDDIKLLSMEASTSRPLWISVNIPQDAKPGVYKGTLSIISDTYNAKHPFSIEVINHTLPNVKDWEFHLDLWQNPYSDARVYNVELWSDEHFKVIRKNYKMLAGAGQKVITTTLIHDPWSSQTYDVYGGMIKWTKKENGTWAYDYSIFDKWVEFMMDLGINKQINAYSMIPWTLEFRYFDEKLNEEQVLNVKPDSKEYASHWGRMLTDFAAHLKKKDWFEITTIAMDERPEKDMNAAIAIIKKADPLFSISMAGNYHEELQASLKDYSVASNLNIPEEIMSFRKENNMNTTFYTACPEPFPNAFTSSDYAELTWLPWHAIFKGYDGYLRWDYNNWPKDPFLDSRYAPFPSGDTYFVYPGGRSSIRFERLREGIQDFEKVRILKKYLLTNNDAEGLKRLEDAINQFTLESLDGKNAHIAVRNAQGLLNNF